MITYDADFQIFASSLINKPGYFSGFTTRAVGDGRKTSTISNFLNSSEIKYQKVVIPEQIHSANVAIFRNRDRENYAKIEETDGVITQDNEVVLTTVTADCCPMIFKDEMTGTIGISHVGWRGSLKRMPQKMIAGMEEVGSRPENITVAIGPTIGDCCYDVTDDRYYQFLEEDESQATQVFNHHGGKWHLNLAFLNYLLLREVGIKKENIDHFPFCTKCDRRFFSYRRDKKEDYGEMFSFVVKSV